MGGRAISGLVIVAIAVSLAGCGSTVTNPLPVIISLNPNTMQEGSAGFTLVVGGRNFVSGATVLWNGNPRITFFISSVQLQATINPADVAMVGTAAVSVVNGLPGGGFSGTLPFTITPQPGLIPTVTSLSPPVALAGGAGFTLIVNGTNFNSSSVVTWNGGNRTTAFINPTQLQASILNTDIAVGGSAQVGVLNPPPGGGASTPVTYQINNPLPNIAALSQQSAQAGAAGFNLTVGGTGFVCAVLNPMGGCTTSGTVVNWNGSPRMTTFSSTTQLTVAINTTDLSTAQIAQITATNSAPGGGTSSPVVFAVNATSTGTGLPQLVDLSNTGAQASNGIGNLGSSGPVTAAAGRYVAFASVSNNLVAGLANGVSNVFVRDTCLGVTAACLPSTQLVSVATNGALANAPSQEPSISSSGRFVVFSSTANNLGASTNVEQVYLRDTCIGVTAACTQQTTLVSLGMDGMTPGTGPSSQPFISPDGQFVAFASTATNLVSTSIGGAQAIFLRNTCAGVTGTCTPVTTLVTFQPDNTNAADGTSSQPVVGNGGRFVAFSSTATSLVSIPSGGIQQVYWRDTCTGATGCTPTTALVSIGSNGTSSGTSPSSQPSLSTDGRFVAFSSTATNLVTGVNSAFQQIYVRDTCTGAAAGCSQTTSLISIGTDGLPGGADSQQPQLSSTGQFVVFSSAAANLVTTGANGFKQIYARNTCAAATGTCTAATVLASVGAGGTPVGNGDSTAPAISSDGHFTAFISFAENLVSDDTTATLEDIFLAVTSF